MLSYIHQLRQQQKQSHKHYFQKCKQASNPITFLLPPASLYHILLSHNYYVIQQGGVKNSSATLADRVEIISIFNLYISVSRSVERDWKMRPCSIISILNTEKRIKNLSLSLSLQLLPTCPQSVTCTLTSRSQTQGSKEFKIRNIGVQNITALIILLLSLLLLRPFPTRKWVRGR